MELNYFAERRVGSAQSTPAAVEEYSSPEFAQLSSCRFLGFEQTGEAAPETVAVVAEVTAAKVFYQCLTGHEAAEFDAAAAVMTVQITARPGLE